MKKAMPSYIIYGTLYLYIGLTWAFGQFSSDIGFSVFIGHIWNIADLKCLYVFFKHYIILSVFYYFINNKNIKLKSNILVN